MGRTKPKIAPFSGQYSDADPFFTPEGEGVYFISYRPIKQKSEQKNDFDIWFTTFNNGNFGEPVHLDEIINTDKDELYPSVSMYGNLYFSTENGNNGYDLMVSKYTNG